MRDLFPGYYQPTPEEFETLWQEAIFSFDANILLNIYRYSAETRERLFEIIERLIERIWIPHQVAYEYQKERLTVISQQSKPYDEIRELLDDELEKLKKKLEEYSKRHSFTDCVDSQKIIQTIERANKRVYKILEEGREKYPDLLDDDEFREKLTNLLEGKVGKPYSDEELDKIYKDAKKRFEKNQPPGYMDDRGKNKKDEPEKYGDVVIWRQLIDYAKSQNKSLIFVTDDQKEDWWLKHQGKTIGVRPELVQEMLEKAGVNFYLYTGDKFLEYASSFLKLTEQPEAIEEAREVRLQTSSYYSMINDIQRQINQYQLPKTSIDDIQRQINLFRNGTD
ncbi:MAG: PIN-like domain-containing protein [Coleofasciculus sp. A1-SPW-01]|uniref:PIN domain-containing protein n=2 Tax=unclassified Coleofasciculus TaxID=2692782 RepID=UPI0032F55C56